jgi:hypothetical protein
VGLLAIPAIAAILITRPRRFPVILVVLEFQSVPGVRAVPTVLVIQARPVIPELPLHQANRNWQNLATLKSQIPLQTSCRPHNNGPPPQMPAA